MQQILDFIEVNGFAFEPTFDGELQRFDRKGSNNAWAVGREFKDEGRDIYSLVFGDWKTGEQYEFLASDVTPETKKKAKAFFKEQKKAERRAREAGWERAAEEIEKEWDGFSERGSTPYLQRKQLRSLHGARIKANEQGQPILIVPLRDIAGKIWNYQRIYAQKLEHGDKFFCDGARIEGLFHVVRGELNQTKTIYIAEGFATAASVADALGESAGTVVCAFTAGNLGPVAGALRAHAPDASIVVCADNDAFTEFKGKPYNVGVEKGRRAAGAVGGLCLAPVFAHPAKGLTDYNDLALAQGLEAVREQLLTPNKALQPVVVKSGKITLPTQAEVCEKLLRHYGDNLLAEEKTLFEYNGKFWVEMDEARVNALKREINSLAGNMLDARQMREYFSYVLIYIPHIEKPMSLFKPNPYAANFQDGTLHFLQQGRGKWSHEFRPHSNKDYLVSALPAKYPQGDLLAAPRAQTEALINSLWQGEDERRLYKQCLGAALAPIFPIILLLHGPTRMGKSTAIKLIAKMVHEDNTSNVQLCDMHGFNMESMVGKLVNFDTDIDLNKPMNDSQVKKIIDRMPFRINRKYRTDVTSFLPALHLFAANALPKSLDGASHAYGKRLACLYTAREISDARIYDYENVLISEELQGLYAIALEGLLDLISLDGHYTIPESSERSVAKIEMGSDIVGQFLEALGEGDFKNAKSNVYTFGETLRLERRLVWEVAREWLEDSFPARIPISKHQFYQALETRGFKLIKSDGVYCFEGFGVKPKGGSAG